MAFGIPKTVAPAYLASSATNIYTPPTGGAGGSAVVLTHLHFCNVTTAQHTFSLYIGATGGSAGGTEIFKDYPVAPKGTYDYYCYTPLASTQFLSGLADQASSITITVEYLQVPVFP